MPDTSTRLKQQLSSLARLLRAYRAARGLILWLAACALVLSVTLVILCFTAPTQDAHFRLLQALITVGAVLFAVLVAIPLLGPVRSRSVARLLEKCFPDLQDRLLAAVDPASPGQESGENSLTTALAAQVAARLQGEKLWSALDFAALRRVCLAALPCVLVLLLIVLSCPRGLATLLSPPASVAPVLSVDKPEPEQSRAAELSLYDLTVTVAPPRYSALGGQSLSEGYEKLRVLKGTRITVQALCSRGAAATIAFNEAAAEPVSMKGARLSHSFTVTRNISWRLSVSAGATSASLGPFSILTLDDARPTVRITSPGRDLSAERLRPVKLSVEATDDFGLARVALLYRLRGVRAWSALPLGEGGRSFSSSFEWDLSPMRMKPGDTLEYRAVATDNDTVSGPKSTTSRTYTVSLAKPEPVAATPEAVQEVQEREQDALDKLRSEARAFDQQLKQMIEAAQKGPSGPGAAEMPRGQLQEAGQRLEERADQVRDAMAQAEQSLAENPLVTDDLIQKVQQLHQLMAELVNEDLKRVMDLVRKAMDNVDNKQFTMSLEQAREAQQQFMDKLDRTIELLRKAKLEAQLEALKQFVERLAEEQEAIKDEALQLPEGRQATKQTHQQQRLAEQTRPVADKVRGIAEEMVRQSEQIASDLRALADEFERREPAGKMLNAAAQLHEGKPAKAVPSQLEAIDALRQTAAGLARAAADITAADRRELTGAANDLTRGALRLSQGQEAAMERLRPLASSGRVDVLQQKSHLSELKSRQEVVRQGTQALAARMRDVARKTSIMPPEMARRADDLNAEMARAAAEIDAGQTAVALSRQGRAMSDLNELAGDLMKLSKQLNQASAQMALQEYMKRLEELAQRQKSINQRTGDDGPPQPGQQQGQQGGQSGGGQPMPGPGSAGQLALEQALVREALQKLLSGKGSGKLGDQLGGVPAQMEKVEDNLRGNNVTRETLTRQRDILHKMLDAQRSLYSKKKDSKERKAEAPKAYEPAASPPVLRPDQTRPPTRERGRRDFGASDLPLDFENITREYLDKVSR